MAEKQAILELKGVSKAFGGIPVLSEVDLQIYPGEVHAIMGENGAGKSTLMKIIMGIYGKDEGEVLLRGEACDFKGARDALHHGISMIHQELSPIPEMTVAENIFLGRECRRKKSFFVDYREQNRRCAELLSEYRFVRHIKPTSKMKSLNIAQVQMIEIIKALSYDSGLIIMDEPTSSLSNTEAGVLFDMIAQIKAKGVAVVYISHRMEEVFMLADRVSVLRDGRHIASEAIERVSPEQLVAMMVGRELSGGYPKNTAAPGEVLLEVEGLSAQGQFEDISFKLREGEILGFAGLIGAGRSELMRALVGYDRYERGTLRVLGEEVKIRRPRDAQELRMVLASEDRKALGLVLCRSIRENIALQNMKLLSAKGFVRRRREQRECLAAARRHRVKMNSIGDRVEELSGGNQQKVVLAKSLLAGPRIFIMDEPTRGIDVGAKAEIYNTMVELTQRGIGIILVSSDMPELIGMSDRILVMSGGRICGEIENRSEFDQEKILKLALGGTSHDRQEAI